MSSFTLPDGIYPVSPTPMMENGSLDISGFNACLDFYLDSEVAGIAILGSGGELPYLSDAEQYDLALEASMRINGKKPIIIGLNAFSEHQALEKIERIQGHADTIMLLLHRYYDVSFTGLQNSLEKIASQSSIPILYYHFPQVSGLWLSPKQLASLMEIDNIVGMKDSSLNNHSAKKILASKACANYFTALSLFMPSLYPLGATKAICPLGATSPAIANDVYKKCSTSSPVENSEELQKLVELLSITANPEKSGKSLWRLLSLISRLPISPLKTASSPHIATKEALRVQGVPIQLYSRSLAQEGLPQSTLSMIRATIKRIGIPVV